MAADKRSLEALHDALADDLAAIIKTGATVVDKEGNVQKITAPAAYHAVALALLKHNGIQTKPLPASPTANLVDALPFAGREIEDAEEVRH